jgi:ABC-type amino acid transport substrate-binding protein
MSTRATERLLNVLIFIGVVVLLIVVGYPQYKESLPSKVRIGVDKSFYSVPFYVAVKDTSRNYFTIEKIEPEFIEIDGNPLQGLKENQYDVVAIPWYWLIINPNINGDTVKCFCSLEIKSGRIMDAIIIPPKSKIKKINDLKGKTLGYLSGDEYLVNLILPRLEEDYNLANIKKIVLKPEEILTAFAEKKADALYLVDPYRGYMVYQENIMLIEGLISNYVVPSLPYAAIVMRKNFVKTENRLAGIRIKNAIEATISHLARNPEITKDIIIDLNNWVHDGALTLNIRTPEYQRLSEINLQNVERLQTELVKRGIGTCGIKPNEFLFEKTAFAR